MSANQINQILFEQSYEIESGDGQFSVINKAENSKTNLLLWFLGMGLLIAGIFIRVSLFFLGEFFLVGALIAMYSLVRELNKEPRRILFDQKHALLFIQYDLQRDRLISFKKINEIVATISRHTNLKTPFSEGTKKFDYDIVVRTNHNHEYHLMRLEFKKQTDHDMQELAFLLNELMDKNRTV